MSYARRTDATHAAVLTRLRDYGWLVLDTHALPHFVDAVGYGRIGRAERQVHLIEVKTHTGGYTASQQALLRDGWPVLTLRSAEDVDRLLGPEAP